MTDEEYGETQQHAETQQHVVMIATLVKYMDLDGFLERISLAHSVGPILNPTLYRDAIDDMSKIETLADALRTFQATAKEVLEEESDA